MDADCGSWIVLLYGAGYHIGDAVRFVHRHGGINPDMKIHKTIRSRLSGAQFMNAPYGRSKGRYMSSQMLSFIFRQAYIYQVPGRF